MLKFLQSLFRPNPTAAWRETVTAPPVDLRLGRVMGLGFKTRSAAFAALGPATQWPAKNGNGVLRFPAKGLELDFEFDQLVGLTLYYADYLNNPDLVTHPFAGMLLAGGAPVALRGGESEQQVVSLLGAPDKRDDDEEETAFHYQYGNVAFEVEIDKRAGLAAINLLFEGDVRPI